MSIAVATVQSQSSFAFALFFLTLFFSSFFAFPVEVKYKHGWYVGGILREVT